MNNWAKCGTLTLFALIGIATIGLGQQAPGFVVRLPQEVKPEMVTIAFGGYSPFGQVVNTRDGIYEYPVAKGADSLKLLIYCPGYRMVTADFKKDALSSLQTFVPSLEKLPTTPLEVRLVNAQQQPLSNQTLHVTYWFTEAMRYFGYTGGAPRLQIATLKTNERGVAQLQLPSLADDPFFQAYKSEGERFEIFSEWVGLARQPSDDSLLLASFAAQKSYTQPLIITKSQPEPPRQPGIRIR